MEPRLEMVEKFKVVGISARTSNEYEVKGNGKIPELWKRFQNERTIEKMNDRSDASVVAVYTDYEGDEKGLYTLLIGGRFSVSKQGPDNMKSKIVPSGKYLVFACRKGLCSEVVLETWMYIWDWFSKSDVKRSYVADFELCDERGQIEIYIGVT